jgi:OOP family OmpA-OmpF porin
MTTRGTTAGRARGVLAACAVAAAALVLGGSAAATTTPSTSPSEDASPSDDAPAGDAAGTSTPDLVEPETSADGVEVRTYGVIEVRAGQDRANAPVTMALHGVHRVENGTVVYYSAGQAPGASPARALGLSDIRDPTRGSVASFGSVRITDLQGGNVYRTVANPEGEWFNSTADAFPEEDEEVGTQGVLFAVLPELPAETTAVNVQLLNGQTIQDVPVEDGLLEPTVTDDPSEFIALGTGWPEIDEQVVAQVDGARWTYPLIQTIESLDESQTETREEQTVTLDLQADVLFAFDSADLSAAARTTVTELADKLVADGATGEVQVVGHTDSQGSDSYNQDLSERRAQAVAAVLQPALEGQSLTFAVSGQGEDQPVASNSSDEGRQLNRRVTIVYTTGGS